MPQRKCAQKRLRVDKTKAIHNLKLKTDLKKELKSLKSLFSSGKLEDAREKLKTAYAKLDRASAKGIIHKNTASRKKASFARLLNSKA